MELYGVFLASLIFFNIALAYHRHHLDKRTSPEESLTLPVIDSNNAGKKFAWEYFSLYSMVMAADWLQVRGFVSVSCNSESTPSNKLSLSLGTVHVHPLQG